MLYKEEQRNQQLSKGIYFDGMNEQVVEAMSFCMKKFAKDERNRGTLVQQKGIRLLGDL